jgi:endonuclease/exonuclease/phosphatase family metal-dependent hydrolase
MLAVVTACDKPETDGGVVDERPPHEVENEKEKEDVDVKPTFTKSEGVVRLLSYNVGAFSKENASSITMIAKMIKELDADIVGMNEVDSCTTRTGRVNQAKNLAEMLGDWSYVLATLYPYKEGGYGNAIVMSPDYKLTGKNKIQLPRESTSHEIRSCAVAKNEKFVFMATHLEVKSNSARVAGAKAITDWAVNNYGKSDVPVFLCGDMNCEPNDEPITELKKNWTMLSVTKNTYPAINSKKCIDFIFVLKNNANYELVASDVPTNFKYGDVKVASDHLPVYVDVKLK